jgi:DNA-directed RNA polymerase subunit beta'
MINTTVGRVLFNASLPKEMPFVNGLLKKKGLQQLVGYCYLKLRPRAHGRDARRAEDDGLHSTRPGRASRSASTT